MTGGALPEGGVTVEKVLAGQAGVQYSEKAVWEPNHRPLN